MESSESFLELIDEVVKRWGQIVVPLYIEKPNARGIAIGLGTAFVAVKSKHPYLVTAHHVISDLVDGQPVAGNFFGQGVLLNRRGIRFAAYAEEDIAVMSLTREWAEVVGLERQPKGVDLDANHGVFRTVGRYVLLGYPKSRNELNPRVGKVDWQLCGYSFNEKLDIPLARSHTYHPIAFRFDKRAVTNSQREPVNPPTFKGNSGGPVFEVIEKPTALNGSAITVRLTGVFTGWHEIEREAHCSSVSALEELIESM